MAWIFRKRVKLLPGIHLNISSGGISVSVGGRGGSVTFGKKGTYVNASIPGTGLYSRKKISPSKVTSVPSKAKNKDKSRNQPQIDISKDSSRPHIINNDSDCFDPLFDEAARLIVSTQNGHTSLIQRYFTIGYNRAGRIMDEFEKVGIVGEPQGANPRDVLIQDITSLETLLDSLKGKNQPLVDISKGSSKSHINKEKDRLDPLLDEAARLIVSEQCGLTSLIQRKFSIGFNRAGRIMEQLEKVGIVGEPQGAKPRNVLIQDTTSLEALLDSLKK